MTIKRSRSGDPITHSPSHSPSPSPSPSLSEQTSCNPAIAVISNLSIHALRVELQRRRLSTCGTRSVLERRLVDHFTDFTSKSITPHHFPSFITVPSTLSVSTTSLNQQEQITKTNGYQTSSDTNNNNVIKETTLETVKQEQPEQKEHCVPFTSNTNPQSDITTNNNPSPIKPPTFIATPRTINHENKINKKDNNISTASSAASPIPFTGVIQGRSVWICGDASTRAFWSTHGPLGKGNLSRSSPCYSLLSGTDMRGRAMRQFLEMTSANRQSRADVEHLQLSLVEAYYAAYVLKILKFNDDYNSKASSYCNPAGRWYDFCMRSKPSFFPALFVAYSRYRATGWLPRSGLKYGCDWVLYPASAVAKRHTHSLYCVVLKFPQKDEYSINGRRIEKSWVALQNRLRLIKNVAKTLVVVDVNYDLDMEDAMCRDVREAFKHVKITELTIDRWVP